MKSSLQKKSRFFLTIKFAVLLFVLLNVNEIIGQIQPNMVVRGTINSFGNSAMTYRGSLNQTWIATIQATTTNATAGFLFSNNGSFSPKWARGAAVTFNAQTDWFNNGADGTYNQVNGNFYTFIIRDVASFTNTRGYVFQTSAAPVSVSTVAQSPVAGSVATGNAVVVTATTSANLPTGQGVFLRYSTNNFSSSTILNMTGSASTYTATIPASANTLGANVVYYVFTSGGTTPMAVADADFATINLNNNSGSNYSYTVVAPFTYTWNQTGTASWATATNWTPTRTTPNPADILQFNNGATTTVTNVPATQTIGGILVSNNTNVTLASTTASALTIGNSVSGADLSVGSGSSLNVLSNVVHSINVATGASGSISGNMTFAGVTSNTAHVLSAADANGITFATGSSFTQNTFNSGNVFGNGTNNSVVFSNGATFNHFAGSNPFQKTQPASVVVFQSGSTYVNNQLNGNGLSFSGRTYGNIVFSGTGTVNGSGSAGLTMDNLTINSGIFNLNLDIIAPSIRGNIVVESGATLGINQANTGVVNLNSGSTQTITNNGSIIIGANGNLTVVSGTTVDVGTSVITGTGTFTVASGATFRTGNVAGISATGATGSIQTTTRTFNGGANYVYNGVDNQITGTGLPSTVNTLTINNTGISPNNIVTLSGITGISSTTNSLRLLSGRLDLNTRQLTIPAGGTVTSTGGDFTTTAGPLYFIGAGTVSGTVNFPTVRLSGGVNFGTASTIVTSMLMESGSFVNTNPPTYASGSTLIYNTTGTYGRNLEWSATSGAGYPHHVQIQNGTTVDLSTNGFANRAIGGNLNLGVDGGVSAGSLTMGATTNRLTIGGNIVIGGNTTGSSVLTLSSAIGGDIYLSGNWDTKTNGSYNSNTRAVFFEGAGTSTVSTIGSATFDFLFVNKTSGGIVNLANDMTVNNNLTLNAQLVTNSFKVIIPASSGVTANANGWVRGNLQKNIPTGTVSRTFEVGDLSVYTPVTTAYSGVTTAGNIIVSTTTNDHPQIANSNIVESKSVNRNYTITNSGVAGGSYDATFTFVAGDLDTNADTSLFGISNFTNPTWTPLTVSTRTMTSTRANGITIYGDFQIGETRTVWTGGASTTDWATPGNWSFGVPTSTTNTFIDTASVYPIISSTASTRTLTVNSGTTLEVASGFNLTVVDVLTNNGTFTVANNANLIQVNDTNNVGAITVNRNSSALMRLDYTIWSSPVASQNLLSFSPLTMANRFYVYNPSNNQYAAVTPSTTNFAEGIGYLIRMPDNHPTSPTTWSGSFVGVPHNGDVTITVANNTYNAVGNPYPSTIDADDFINDNNLTEALYFWRKTNAAAGSAYATYTLAGGAGTGGSGSSSQIPNGIIQVGQGFIARSTSTSLVFNNLMRVADNNNQFFRSATNSLSKSRIWLNLNQENTILGQTMVAYMEGTTTDLDAKYDGKYINDSQTAITSVINNEEYAVQARGEFAATDVVPMTIKLETAGNYTISLAQVDGVFSTEHDIFVRDIELGVEHDIRTAPYSFSAPAGVLTNRFELVYQSTLSVENPTFNNVVVFSKNKALEINAGNEIISSVSVFDIRGKKVAAQEEVNSSATSLDLSGVANQVLIVQIKTNNGQLITKKVVH